MTPKQKIMGLLLDMAPITLIPLGLSIAFYNIFSDKILWLTYAAIMATFAVIICKKLLAHITTELNNLYHV